MDMHDIDFPLAKKLPEGENARKAHGAQIRQVGDLYSLLQEERFNPRVGFADRGNPDPCIPELKHERAGVDLQASPCVRGAKVKRAWVHQIRVSSVKTKFRTGAMFPMSST